MREHIPIIGLQLEKTAGWWYVMAFCFNRKWCVNAGHKTKVEAVKDMRRIRNYLKEVHSTQVILVWSQLCKLMNDIPRKT